MADGKTCPRCGEHKPLDTYGANKRMKDGKQIHCRPCRTLIQRESRARNPEPTRRYSRERARRLAEDPEFQEWRKANRRKHRETTAAYNRRYYEANRETIRARGRAWSEANPDRYRPPGSGAKHSRVRRARKRDLPTEPYTFDEILQRDEGRCGLCGQPITGPLETDHIVPISRGGPDTPANVRLAHRSCNRRKHKRLDEELDWVTSS